MAEVEVEQRAGATGQASKEEKRGEANPAPPAKVTFPDAARRRAESFPPPLKLEAEESEDTSPRTSMWQVYAIGGFLILRWIWARWRERRNRRSDEDSSTSS